MDSQEKTKLVRAGNNFFNKGQIEKAQAYFIKAKYNSGIRQIADYYFYDKKDILQALPLYMKCRNEAHIEESYKRIAGSIQEWLKEDKKKEDRKEEDRKEDRKAEIITTKKVKIKTQDTDKRKEDETKEKPDKEKTKTTNKTKTLKSPIKKSKSVAEQIKEQLLKKHKR